MLGLCALGAAVLVYRHDLYEREPLLLLALTVALGAGGMWLAGQAEAWTLGVSRFTGARAIAAVAALEEELMKLLVVVAIALLARREFNDPMDGLIYGSMAGLGMAVEESVYYMRQLPPGKLLLPPAELVRVSGHLVMGGISGFALGMAALRRERWPLVLIACFCAATTLHFGWDWIVLSAPGAALGTREAWSGAALMLAGLLLYGALTAIASEQSHRLFAPGSPSRLWGWPFRRR